jgi:predicted nucleotide-binding protein (sugar kinase/HSP70/actin superfamily)
VRSHVTSAGAELEVLGFGATGYAADVLKVAQAHLHNLLFRHHQPMGKRGPLHYLFFPIITHLQNPLRRTGDNASCPLVAGTPEVVKAAFTKEIDFFGQRGIEYVNTPVTFDEPNLLSERMFEAWRERLGVTRDECVHAHRQGLAALAAFDRDLQEKGRAVLGAVEAEHRLALLVLGRPYHSDPGLNHGIPEEFQALGYPILSVRSLPRDPEFLSRFFPEEIARGQDPLDIADVWPENYSANSAQKVWAAKLGARHPNIALLDFSSFKCGHDAPTYGLIDAIVAAAGAPYAALHDLDANKPGSSLKIRVKTYHHTLELRQEALEDAARRERELALSLAQKRLELLARRQAELEGRAVHGPALAAQTESLAASAAAQRPPERPGRGGAPAGIALHRRPAAQAEAKEVA